MIAIKLKNFFSKLSQDLHEHNSRSSPKIPVDCEQNL